MAGWAKVVTQSVHCLPHTFQMLDVVVHPPDASIQGVEVRGHFTL